MKTLTRVLAAFSLGLVAALATPEAGAQSTERVFKDRNTHRVFWRTLTLSPGTTHEMWVTLGANLRDTVEPVVVLLDSEENVVERVFGEETIEVDLTAETTAQTYYVLVHALSPATGHIPEEGHRGHPVFSVARQGQRARVYVSIPIVGNLLRVPCGEGSNEYQAVLRPGGASDPLLFGFDEDGVFLRFDNDGGVWTGAALTGNDVCRVILGRTGGSTPGRVDFYVNDLDTSGDADRLGPAFEEQLGTCDTEDSTPDNCDGVIDAADTDLDGLTDTAETFGVDDETELTLPRWGANPLHKDIFIEVDYRSDEAATAHQLTGDDAVLMQELLGAGPASQLGNPDGQPGVNVHLDLGIEPTDPAHLTLYGDWGGSGARLCETRDNGDCAADGRKAMAAARVGRFFYGLDVGSGGGQGANGRFHFGNTGALFIHEFGHALGLRHGGHNSVNCKPNYTSLMSYAFMDGENPRFYDGSFAPPSIRREGADEAEYVDADWAAALKDSAFSSMVLEDGSLDFNRDGLYPTSLDGEPPRAPMTLADTDGRGGCGQQGDVYQLAPYPGDDAEFVTPAIVRAHPRVWESDEFASDIVFFVGVDGAIHFRGQRLEGVAEGDAFRDEVVIPNSEGAEEINAATVREPSCNTGPGLPSCPQRVVVVARLTDGTVKLFVSAMQRTDEDGGYGLAGEEGVDAEWSAVTLPIRTAMRPDVAQITGAGSSTTAMRVAVVYVNPDTNSYDWLVHDSGSLASLTDPARWETRPFLDQISNPIAAGQGPGITTIDPIGPFDQAGVELGVGVFTDSNRNLHVYAFDPEAQVWRSKRSLPTAEDNRAAATIAFASQKTLTQSNPLMAPDLGVGRLHVGWRTSDGYGRVWVTSPFDVLELSGEDALEVPAVMATMKDIWATLPGSTAIDFYQGPATMGLRAAFWNSSGLGFAPFSDGTSPTSLGAISDFKILSRSICATVRGNTSSAKTRCGTDNDDYYRN